AKSESTAKLIEFINFIENQTNERKGILHELTAADSPQSNSVAERFKLIVDSAYRCWDDNRQEIVISRDVTFDETSALELAKDYIPPEELYEVEEILDSRDGPEGPEFLCKWHTWEPIKNVNHLTVFANYINEKTAIALSAASTKEPQTYKQALSSDDAPKWTEAINAELKSLHTNETWEVINPKSLPHNQRPIRTKWVFKIKRDLNGQPQRYKARLIVKGFKQRYGIDYNETYAPVAKIATQRVLLALAASLGLKCHQMDVVTAFLNGIVTEMILIYAPEGSGFPPGTILRLRKALYGLKQAPCKWYSLLHKELTFLGFKRLANDNAVYIRTLPESDSLQYISVYVDDLLIFAKNKSEISSIKASLHNEFNMTDLGEVNHYLGMRVRCDYTRHVIYLDQESYVNDILVRFGRQDCKPVNTPMDQTKLETYEVENTKTSPTHRKENIAKSLDLSSTPHLNICKLQSVFFATYRGLLLTASASATTTLPFTGTVGNNIIDRWSITGYLFCIGNAGPVTWASKRQPTVALSSTEAEYMALSFATQETIWLRSLLKELQIPEYLDENARPTTIYEDNQSCISLAMNPVHHARTKHIDIRHHKEIHLEYLPTAEMVADSLTKPLPAPAFKYHRENMCIKHYDNTITPMTKASMTELPNE
ncbi:DNA-directed DNA polymerase, partial [Powellomyces hirtus]